MFRPTKQQLLPDSTFYSIMNNVGNRCMTHKQFSTIGRFHFKRYFSTKQNSIIHFSTKDQLYSQERNIIFVSFNIYSRIQDNIRVFVSRTIRKYITAMSSVRICFLVLRIFHISGPFGYQRSVRCTQ